MGSTGLSSASARIASFAAGFEPDRLSGSDIAAIRRAVMDCLSVAYAGRNEPAAQIAVRYASRYGRAVSGLGQARVWSAAHGPGMDAEAAALVNGVAGHVLDFDDVTEPMRGHPSVALLPALIALGEERGLDGRMLLSAYAVGFEIICRLSRAMVDAHYARGWHSTASIGTLAAAAACAHLIGLSADSSRNALGLALAQTAGSRANFGSMAKAFQAGQCGAAALRAVRLAELGFDAAADPLTAPFGYMDLYANGESLDQCLAGLGDPGELELSRSGFEIKKYPMCYATHRVLDGLLALRAQYGLGLATVAQIDVLGSPRAFAPLVHRRPRTGLEGKFSMEYAVAAALADGEVVLASFTDEAVSRAPVQAFFEHVHLREATGALLPRWAELELRLTDGRLLRQRVDVLQGSAAAPLSDDSLNQKVRQCFAWGGRGDLAQAFLDAAMHLERHSIAHLIDCLKPEAPARA